jgi:hypothetical protein
MQKQSKDTVFSLLMDIGRFFTTYPRTYLAFLFHPRSSFSKFFSSSRSQFTKPGVFLGANICFCLLLGHCIGYELPPFPLDLPFLQNIGGRYFSVIFTFLLGILIFLEIFRRLIRYKSFNSFLLRILPILCFSSVVYVPILLAKNYYLDIIWHDFFELFSNFLNGIPPKFLAWTLVRYLLFPPLISLSLIFWWLLLIHTGLSSSKLKSPKLRRRLVLAYILFFGLQLSFGLVVTMTKNWPLLRGFKTLVFEDIQAALSQRPPNFF